MVMKCESFLIKRLFPKNFILDNISAKVIKGFVQTFDSIIYVPRHQDPYYTGNHHYIVPYLEHHYKFNKTKDFLELKEARDELWNISLMTNLNTFYAVNREPLIRYFETMSKRYNGTTEKEDS